MSIANVFYYNMSPKRLNALARLLGLTPDNLSRMWVGWSDRDNAYSFLLKDGEGDVVGIRLRSAVDGSKFAVAGSRQGLHIPTRLGKPAELLLTEGPTDCAAALDLGFPAVGRPSCTGATQFTIDLVKRLGIERVVVVGDNDEPKADGRRPGIEGAMRMATAMAVHAKSVKVILPPAGVKDMRDWLIAGATRPRCAPPSRPRLVRALIEKGVRR